MHRRTILRSVGATAALGLGAGTVAADVTTTGDGGSARSQPCLAYCCEDCTCPDCYCNEYCTG